MNNKSRKMYHAPQLVKLGDLRTLTLGGSVGTQDSGNFNTCTPGWVCVVDNAQKLLPPDNSLDNPTGVLFTHTPIIKHK